MCYECGCYGTVTPYGIGGRDVNQPPRKAKGGIPPKSKEKSVEMEDTIMEMVEGPEYE